MILIQPTKLMRYIIYVYTSLGKVMEQEHDFLMDLLMVMEVHGLTLELDVGDYGEYQFELKEYLLQRLEAIKKCPVFTLVPK